MPGLNQTGPIGQGPLTGRGMGCCSTSEKSKDASPEFMRGGGRGRGQGPGRGFAGRHGRRNRFFSQKRRRVEFPDMTTAKPDVSDLEVKVEATKEALRQMTEQLETLKETANREGES